MRVVQLNAAFPTQMQLCCVFMQKGAGGLVLNSSLGMLITRL